MYPHNTYNSFAGVPQVDARTAHEQFRSGEAAILDVREPSEWELGHIDGADWVPLGDLPVRWRELDPEDSLRFWSLRLFDGGLITTGPQRIIAQNTDWRFLTELKKELKA